MHLLASFLLLPVLRAYLTSPPRLVHRPIHVSTSSVWQYNLGDEQYNIRLLCRMIVQNNALNRSLEFAYSSVQIEDVIRERRIKVHVVNRDSGLYPLRYSIRFGRRDVMGILLKHGAMATSEDSEGMVINELFRSSQPGCLHMLTDLLEGVSSEDAKRILEQECRDQPLKYAVRYWLHRGFTHILPRAKLKELGIPRLDSLKYRIVGQNFALEQILSEIASAYANTELSKKPLVLLFAGPPGHGKSETAKQLADLLQAPFHKVDCRNHAHPWEMFGAGTGFIGSDSGSQLGNFMSGAANGKRSVVLLDEFDHCQAETWEAFYHIFEEGEFTIKKVNMEGKGVDAAPTRTLDCSKTIWLLTTNKFDNDIVQFNQNHKRSIIQYKNGGFAFDALYQQFEDYVRPKLRKYFQGGLTRRINAIVPFFTFDEEEAHVVTDMYVDKLRQMYIQPANDDRKIGEYSFDLTNYAVSELSRAYFKHQLDGASAIVREVNGRIVKKLIHMKWIREEQTPAIDSVVWIHYSDSYGGPYIIGGLSDHIISKNPYFLEKIEYTKAKRLDAETKVTSSIVDTLTSTPWRDPFSKNPSAEDVNSAPSLDMESVRGYRDTDTGVENVDNEEITSSVDHEIIEEVLRNSVEDKDDFQLPTVAAPEHSCINVSVYFEDAVNAVHFVNSFMPTVTVEEVLCKICSSLSIERPFARLWFKLFDDITEAQLAYERLNSSRFSIFGGKRAIVTDITDIVGPWMYIREDSITLGDVLLRRWEIGGIPTSEGLNLLIETALPASKFSSSIQWARDKELNGWRNDLKVGDMIDFEVIAAVNKSEWMEAIVSSVSREYDGELSAIVRLLGGTLEEKVRCSSSRIQPLYSRSMNWRGSLQVGDLVDVRITRGNWQTGVIATIKGHEATVHLFGDGVHVERQLSLYSEDIIVQRTVRQLTTS